MSTSPTSAKHTLTAYLTGAVLVGATSLAPVQEDVSQIRQITRTATKSTPWRIVADGVGTRLNQTASSEIHPVVLSRYVHSDEIVAELIAFEALQRGWDGESAEKPLREAIHQAARFARLAGNLSSRLEPTLHVDGSVILEVENGAEGSLRFKGDDRIIFALAHRRGVAEFNGLSIPQEILDAFES